jgi:hypothetical protein
MQFATMSLARLIGWIVVMLFGVGLSCGFAQQRKTTKERLASARKKALSSITVSTQDTTIHQKSELAYLSFAGRIIRNINIDHVGFEKSLYDTSSRKTLENIARFANNLHHNTREKTIRNNLFIYRNRPLNPYKLADNERYLRDLDFILDARIVVEPVNGSTDSVDLFVFTRDVFSLGGSVTPGSIDRYSLGLYDINVDGRGQRAQLNTQFDTDRIPRMGYQLLYSKNSIKGSLVNTTLSYTQLNNGSSLGLENEEAFLIRFDRPLVSPYTRLAGGLEFSRNWSSNVEAKPISDFRAYSYDVQDAWAGYNIGIKNTIENRNRHFVALRIFQQHFRERPQQPDDATNPVYNNKTFILGSTTFFNQNFYKTRYVYGFGRTEDVPYGKYLTVTAGRVSQLNLKRPYASIEFDKTLVRPNGDFYEFKFQAEGLMGKDDWEDVTLLASASLFSKLISFKQVKLRQYLGISYTTILNQQFNLPLTINSDFGLDGFRADSVLGTQRITLYTQSLGFLPRSILGFRFAPLVFAEVSSIAPKGENLFNQKLYSGVGAGLRTRNENLVFGTIELKVYYFPRVTEDLSSFRIAVSSNLRVKYSSSFVRPPQFIQYN